MTISSRLVAGFNVWLIAILFGVTFLQTEQADVIYPIWICIGLYGLVRLYLSFPNKKLFISLMMLGAIGFLLIKPIIDTIEFWGDEIGVIETARKPFLEIAPFVQTAHAAAPPLDYQNLYWWLRLVENIPLSEREFVWRIPYMLYHCCAAALFAQIVFILATHSKHRTILSLIGWAVYFSHPLGIEYSLDIRFYSLLLLSSVVLLYGLVAQLHTKTWWQALIFIAGLNAITFLIMAWVTFLVYSLIALLTKKSYLTFGNLLFLTTISLGIAITHTKSGSDLNYFSWQQYYAVIQGVSSMSGFFAAVIFAYSYWLIKLKEAPAFTIYTQLTATWFIGLLMMILIIRPYDGIGLRTFLPVLPHLFVIGLSLIIKYERFSLVAIVLIGLQLYWNVPNLIDHNFIERKIIHIKPVCQLAKQNGQRLLIISNHAKDTIQSEWNYSFIAWYTSDYDLTVEFARPDQIQNKQLLKSSYQLYDYDTLTQL